MSRPSPRTKSTAASRAYVRYAEIGKRVLAAQSSEQSSTAEAPSVSGVLLPAVSVPFGPRSNTGFSFASCSRVVSGRMLLSR